jgi:lipoyl-dependent peroxiredoxin subunit D
MSLAELRQSIPDYARDLRLNLESVLTEGGAPGITTNQIAMVALASAIAARHEPLTRAVTDWAAGTLPEAELNGARAAAAIMGMTNVYYRFTHLVSDKEYDTLRAGLRMNVMANPGCDKVGFELASLAVSAITGCGKCVDSHEKVLRQHGLTAQAVQSAARIAAVVNAVAIVLEQHGASTVTPTAVAA